MWELKIIYEFNEINFPIFGPKVFKNNKKIDQILEKFENSLKIPHFFKAIAMHPGTNVTMAPANNLPVVTAAALLAATASGAANPHPVDAIANGTMLSTADPASGLSTMLDQYVAAAAASIQQVFFFENLKKI